MDAEIGFFCCFIKYSIFEWSKGAFVPLFIHDNRMLAERAFYCLSQEDQKAVRKKIVSAQTAFYINDICYENACNSYKLLLPNRPGFCTDRCVSIDSNGSAGTVIRQLPVGNDGILFSRKLQNAAVSDQMKLC